MKLTGIILMLGGIALFFAWLSDASGVASLFIFAAGILFLECGRAKPDPFDDLGRGRLGLD